MEYENLKKGEFGDPLLPPSERVSLTSAAYTASILLPKRQNIFTINTKLPLVGVVYFFLLYFLDLFRLAVLELDQNIILDGLFSPFGCVCKTKVSK